MGRGGEGQAVVMVGGGGTRVFVEKQSLSHHYRLVHLV